MSGPKKQDLNAERASAQRQLDLSERYASDSQDRLNTQKQYQAPLVSFLQGVIGGDMNSKIRTAAVPLGQIATGTQQARENILDSQPAGAARDFALAGLSRDAAAQRSGLLNQVYLNAFPTLANVGKDEAGIGLQLTGAGLRAGEAGGQALSGINNRAAQQKASTLGLIGGLAGAAGSVATGGLTSLIKKPSFGSGGFGQSDFSFSGAGGPVAQSGYRPPWS